jgi:hypothetical protein
MALKQISIKSYSFLYDIAVNGGNGMSINTGLFIPEKTVLVNVCFCKTIAMISAPGASTLEIGWAGTTGALIATQAIGAFFNSIAGVVKYSGAGDPIFTNPVVTPAGGVEIILTGVPDPFFAPVVLTGGKFLVVFQGFEMTI